MADTTLRTSSPKANNEFLLFATSRPSRDKEVASMDQDLAAQRMREDAWADKIGMDLTVFRAAGSFITGSPTGTKAPHQEDDYVDDIGF